MVQYIHNGVVSRLDFIKRFNGHFTFHNESVSTHSYWVVFYVNLLFRDLFYIAFSVKEHDDEADYMSLYYQMYNFIIRHAINHDVEEALLQADVIYTVKYHKDGGEQVRTGLNAIVASEVNKMEPGVLKDELKDTLRLNRDGYDASPLTNIQQLVCMRIIKLCDWLSSYHFCHKELELGNNNFHNIMQIVIEGIRENRSLLWAALDESKLPYSASAIERII